MEARRDTQFSGTYKKEVYQTLALAYGPFLLQCSTLIILGFLGRLLLLSNTNITGRWVDSLCEGSGCQQITAESFLGSSSLYYFYALVGATLLGFLFTITFRIGFSRLSARAVSQLHDEVMLRASRYPMSFYDVTPVGRIVTRFSTDYGNVFRLFGGPLAEFISIISDLICMVILITIASPIYLPWVVVAGLLNYFVYRSNRDTLRRERRALSSLRSPAIAHFAETVQGASSIRAYLKTQSFSSRFAELNDIFLQQKLRTVFRISGFSFQMSAVTASLLLGVGATGYFLVQNHVLTVGSMAVAFSFIVLASNTVQMFFDWLAQFEEAMTGVERLDEYLRRPLELGAKVPSQARFNIGERELQNQKLQLPTPTTACSVEFNDVSLRYRPNLPLILKGVSFKINPGERWGIVGKTGEGKSTLIQALFYLYPLESGYVSIDNLAPSGHTLTASHVQPVDLRVFRSLIGYISQEAALFRGTVRENLNLIGTRSDEEVIDALRKVSMGSWYEALPDGLDFEILERGKNLSSGEKQLLCMARCILQNTPLVVMDEATSFVDPQSEEAISRATEYALKGRTQLIIAHRLSTLQSCDGIIWIKDGRIHQVGRVNEILPLYRHTDRTL